MSVVRGRPPGLAAGIRGASTAYCSSLSACPAPKSPTKTRLSAVHMTCLQEGLLPSLNGWHDHSISSSVSTARASQTGSKWLQRADADKRAANPTPGTHAQASRYSTPGYQRQQEENKRLLKEAMS